MGWEGDLSSLLSFSTLDQIEKIPKNREWH